MQFPKESKDLLMFEPSLSKLLDEALYKYF